MPSTNSKISFKHGTAAGYAAITTKDANTIYFCTDTKQIYVGSEEYTKSVGKLDASPAASTVGDHGKLYYYNGSLYLCEVDGSTYNWTQVANVNTKNGTVTGITIKAGDGIAVDSSSAITSSGSRTISHGETGTGSAVADPISNQTPSHGGTFNIQSVATDKFGHVTGSNTHTVKLPAETALTKGTDTNATAETLKHGGSFTVMVDTSVEGHAITDQNKTFTLPSETALSVSTSEENAETLKYGDSFTVVTDVSKGSSSHAITEKTKTFTLPDAPESYQHPESGVTAGTYRSVTVDEQGHVTGGTNPVLTIAQGGTGKTTASEALAALGGAPIASPTFTGTPKAPTAAAGTNSTQVATTAFVKTAVDDAVSDIQAELSTAMTFKGTLGTGGTITSLPTASANTVGDTYKVITAGTYDSQAAKVGDVFICSDSPAWVLVPSGDEPSGTVTSVKIEAGDGVTVDNSNAITSSGTRIISHGDTSDVEDVTASSRTYVTGLTFDDFGHVTGVTTGKETVTNSDTKVTQALKSDNANYPLLLAPAGQTADKTTTACFDSGVTLNPSTNTIAANISGNAATATKATNADNATEASHAASADNADEAEHAKTADSCSGTAENANTATKLADSKNIKLTGDVTGSASFDGSADASISATLANSGVTAGSYGPSANASPAHGKTFSVPYITVDAKGRVTAASTKTITMPAATTLSDLGVNATATELNYMDGVTSNVQTQLNAKAPLASPTFTGTPKAPTATAGTNSTQIATTAFVQTAVDNAALVWESF